MFRRFYAAIALLAAPAPLFAQAAPPPAAQPIPRASFIQTMDGEFRKMDADKDGQLTRIEIEQFQRVAALAQAQARNRALFAELDADKNGQLTAAEFARVTAATPPVNGQPIIAKMDLNRDQKVSLIEHRAATLINFDRLDTDKDGVVNAAEMRAGGVIK